MSIQTDPRAIPELTPQEKRLQRILKGVVIGLAVLILIVLGLIVVKMIGGPKKKPAPVPAAVSEQVAPAPAGASFATRDIAIPQGAQVVEMLPQGGLLLLRLRTTEGTEQLLVLDLATGTERGRFVLTPGS